MVPQFADFIRETFLETLKRLLHPSSLVAALLFLFLNLTLIFPALSSSGFPMARTLGRLDPFMQALLFVVILLALSYYILSMSSVIFKLATGELWANSLAIGPLFLKWQKMKLVAPLAQRPDTPQNEDRIVPTHLGNVFSRAYDVIQNRYGIDAPTMWLHMETLLAKERPELASRIDNERSTLDFLLMLAFVLFGFAIEHTIVHPWLQTPTSLWWSLVFLIVSFGVYRSALNRGRSLADALVLAFDLYRDKLREALHFRACVSAEDERALWRDAAQWVQTRNLQTESRAYFDSIFPSPPADPPLSIATSANCQVSVKDTVTTLWTYGNDANQSLDLDHYAGSGADAKPAVRHIEMQEHLHYVVLLSSTASEEGASQSRGIYVMISDSRIPSIPAPPNPDVGLLFDAKPTCKKIPSSLPGVQHDLIWSLPELPPNSAVAISYRLYRSDIFQVAGKNLNLLVKPDELPCQSVSDTLYHYTMFFQIDRETNLSDEPVCLEVRDRRFPIPTKRLKATLSPEPPQAGSPWSTGTELSHEDLQDSDGKKVGIKWDLSILTKGMPNGTAGKLVYTQQLDTESRGGS